MTNMIERVARAISDDVNSRIPKSMHMTENTWLPQARAAIRVVVEECARECERYAREYPDDEQRWDVAFEIAAAAIRALAKGDGE